ncbi:MAG: flagellar FlbD family protein [Planctomycetota bacterium]
MITLTRLNQSRFVLNAELIRSIEEKPDTVITLTTGERVVVREPSRDVVDKAIEYGRRLRTLLPPT